MKYKVFILPLILSLGFSSCASWLDVPAEGTPSQASFWKTDKDFNAALLAVYSNIDQEETWGRDLFWEQGASDDVFYSRARGARQMNLANLNMNGSTEGSLHDIYEYMYEMMSRANEIIYRGLQHKSPTERIKQHIGEAYFLRAFAHYMIAYRYGHINNGVPFDRFEKHQTYDPSRIPEQRKSVIDNYTEIIEDLDEAIKLLPYFKTYAAQDWGRASRDAAIALKVKVYAYWAQHDPKQWSKIPALVHTLEQEAGRALEPKFADVFKIENEWGREYIWSVNSDAKTLAGSILPGVMLDNKGWDKINGWGNFKPTLELWAEYEEGDERRPVTLLQYGDSFVFLGETRRFFSEADLECGFHFNKYMDGFRSRETASANANRPLTSLNVPIIRFAEMLLFEAEALIEMGRTNEATQVLNRISSRAGLGNKYTQATIQDLMHERRCELAGEFTDRVMDLKRWSAKYPEAKIKLEAPKHGLAYKDRGNPDSELKEDGADEGKVKTMTINGKEYRGVIEIMPAKVYNPEKDAVLPYDPQQIVKSKGKLKQNPHYPTT